jgi:integrase
VCSNDIVVYVAKRRKEPGMRPGTLASLATINKELRHLRAVFRKAKKLGYLSAAPDFDFLKEPKKLPSWIPPEHLAAMYRVCDTATSRPVGLPYRAADWWRGVLIFGYMTGWRIGSILSLRREDVDLGAGTAISQAEDNKGGRDQIIALPPLVVEHLQRVPSFEPVFFPWPHGPRRLYDDFEAIQNAAGVKPARGKVRYGFHDLRRAFATLNAGRLSADVLQALMQHQSYTTTQRYIDLARQMRPAANDVFVPDLGEGARAPAAGG